MQQDRSFAPVSLLLPLKVFLIYQFLEQPQLGEDIDGKVDSATGTTLTVSFQQWNQLMPGGLPPSQ